MHFKVESAGVWVEGSQKNASKIRRNLRKLIEDEKLELIEAFVTPSNVNRTIEHIDFASINVLSIDVDLDTHHIWSALRGMTPEIAVIEYNAFWRPPQHYEHPYVDGLWWDGQSPEYGASLESLDVIGRNNGYRLVGCDLSGVNAFFVRADLVNEKQFFPPFDATTHFEPSRHLISPPGRRRWK